MKIRRRLGLYGWWVSAPELWRSITPNNPRRLFYALREDVDEWLKALVPIKVPVFGDLPAAKWQSYDDQPFTVLSNAGVVKVGRDQPAIKFWRKSDMLIFKLTWA